MGSVSFSNRRSKVKGIVTGLLSLLILELFSIFSIAMISSNFQTWVWIKEFPNPLIICFVFIPLISALLGLSITKKLQIMILVIFLLDIGFIIYLFYYLIKVIQMKSQLPF
jgi:hypothetical protein